MLECLAQRALGVVGAAQAYECYSIIKQSAPVARRSCQHCLITCHSSLELPTLPPQIAKIEEGLRQTWSTIVLVFILFYWLPPMPCSSLPLHTSIIECQRPLGGYKYDPPPGAGALSSAQFQRRHALLQPCSARKVCSLQGPLQPSLVI